MESGDLKIFQAVAREKSITKAADALNYVQSNVTNRIHKLESHLNTKLFYRTNRGMILTASGENVLTYANNILHLLKEAEKSAQLTEYPKGPLRSAHWKPQPRFIFQNFWRTIIADFLRLICH